jgi:hypothetical protein
MLARVMQSKKRWKGTALAAPKAENLKIALAPADRG